MMHMRGMDASGARLLAARIAAGVRIGTPIELVADAGSELHAGDRGIVRAFAPDGRVMVAWEDGRSREIDPTATPFRRLAA